MKMKFRLRLRFCCSFLLLFANGNAFWISIDFIISIKFMKKKPIRKVIEDCLKEMNALIWSTARCEVQGMVLRIQRRYFAAVFLATALYIFSGRANANTHKHTHTRTRKTKRFLAQLSRFASGAPLCVCASQRFQCSSLSCSDQPATRTLPVCSFFRKLVSISQQFSERHTWSR
jgi:hypothetical protein